MGQNTRKRKQYTPLDSTGNKLLFGPGVLVCDIRGVPSIARPFHWLCDGVGDPLGHGGGSVGIPRWFHPGGVLVTTLPATRRPKPSMDQEGGMSPRPLPIPVKKEGVWRGMQLPVHPVEGLTALVHPVRATATCCVTCPQGKAPLSSTWGVAHHQATTAAPFPILGRVVPR